jgi:hypothetical protein
MPIAQQLQKIIVRSPRLTISGSVTALITTVLKAPEHFELFSAFVEVGG